MEVKIEGDLLQATFIKRLNRFIAIISIDNKEYHAHVPNTGRMAEFLIEGCQVVVRLVDHPHRKTKYDLLMVYYNQTLINIDSKLPNVLLYKALCEDIFPSLKGFAEVKREVTYKNSRFDLSAKRGKDIYLIEAKCVTLVKEGGLASFPDAPTERGRKHVFELIDAVKNGYKGLVIFIIQREDAISFTPNASMDKEFAEAVKKAREAGVEILAFNCKVEQDRIAINNSIPISIL